MPKRELSEIHGTGDESENPLSKKLKPTLAGGLFKSQLTGRLPPCKRTLSACSVAVKNIKENSKKMFVKTNSDWMESDRTVWAHEVDESDELEWNLSFIKDLCAQFKQATQLLNSLVSEQDPKLPVRMLLFCLDDADNCLYDDISKRFNPFVTFYLKILTSANKEMEPPYSFSIEGTPREIQASVTAFRRHVESQGLTMEQACDIEYAKNRLLTEESKGHYQPSQCKQYLTAYTRLNKELEGFLSILKNVQDSYNDEDERELSPSRSTS